MLEELQARVHELLANCQNEDCEKYQIIERIIATDNWYEEIDADTCISILVDLEYTVEEAKVIYMQLKGIK